MIKQVLFQNSVVRDAGRTVSNVDDAAFLKTFFQDRLLHHYIIMMRVDAKMSYHTFTIADTGMQDTTTAVSCDAMDRPVRR